MAYEDGTTVVGWFGENSLAATVTERSDLFLERLYFIAEDGSWTEPTPPRSGLVSLRNVRSIEFLDLTKEKGK